MNTEVEDQEPVESPATRLRLMRLEMEINQRELARRANVSHSLVSVLESGKRKTLSIDTGARIAKALGVTLAWLRCEPGAKKEKPNPVKSGIVSVFDSPRDPEDIPDLQENPDVDVAFQLREDLADALMATLAGMRALPNDATRDAVLELYKIMIDYPEKCDNLKESIHTLATTVHFRSKMFNRIDIRRQNPP